MKTRRRIPLSHKIRAALSLGFDEERIMDELGCSSQDIRDAKRRSPTRGRPRVNVHPAEACARMIEAYVKNSNVPPGITYVLVDVAADVRDGKWKEYLKP